jgi:type I restriction enzyme S subunit
LHKKYGNEVEISLVELGKFYNGLSGKSGDDFGSGQPYITYLNVYQNDIVNESMVGYVKISDGEKQHTVHYGDALFTISSETPEEVGISSVYLGEKQELYLNSFCFGYRLDDFTILNPKYMPYCFSSYRFRKFVYPLAQGSTRFNLHMHHFLYNKFKIPTPQKQILIMRVLDSFSEKLRTEKQIQTSLKEQRIYFLKELFI